MKKRMLLLLTVFALCLTLSACIVIPDGDGEKSGDGRVYSSERGVSLIVSADGAQSYESSAYGALYKKLYDAGIDVKRVADDAEPAESEIAMGRTDRAASAYAYERIDAAYKSGNITYAICYKNATLAIAAADEASFALAMEYFYGELATGDSLTVPTDLDVFVNMTAEEYAASLLAEKKARELADYERRWDEVAELVDAEGLRALQGFYSDYCGPEVYEWIAGLYDPDTGAIYYADSARAYEGFAPDLESTYQAYGILRDSGMMDIYKDQYGNNTGKAIVNMLPEGAKETLITWVRSMQDPDTGYFYHPQWGSSVGSSRRGRDLDWAITLLGWLDVKALYPTALDRLSGATSTATAVSRVIAAQSSMPEHLQSEEAFLEYLNSFNIRGNSHDAGHTISSQTSQIKAAGLGEVAIEFFDELQRQIFEEMQAAYEADPENNPKPTGLWQDEANYTSISGFYKIAIMYANFGYGMNYLDYALESAFTCIMSDDPATNMVYVFNPWATLSNVFSAMERSNSIARKNGETEPYDIEASHGKVRERCAELVSKTAVKLAAFHKGNSFSYYPDGSASYTQGTWVSMGLEEGDVNATMLAVSSTVNAIFNGLGVDSPAKWNSDDFDRFYSMINEAGDIVKLPRDTAVYYDFESLEEGDGANGISGDSGVVIDPTNENNKAISLATAANESRSSYILTSHGKNFGYAFFEADFMVIEGSGTSHQLEFRGSDVSYMATLTVSGGFVKVGETNDRNSGVTVDTGIYFPVGEWCTLRFELYTAEDTLRVKYYTLDENGEYVCRYVSENFYGSDAEDAVPFNDFSQFGVFSLKKNATVLLMDNIVSEKDGSKKFDGSDYTPASESEMEYDFESPSPFVSIDGVMGSYVAEGSDGSNTVLQLKRANDGAASSTADLRVPAEATESLRIEFDLYADYASTANMFQIGLGGVGSKATYLINVTKKNGKLVIGDLSSTADTATAGSFDCQLEFGRKYRVTLELALSEDPEEFAVSLYIDGELVTYEGADFSQNYGRAADGDAPRASVNGNKLSFRPNGTADFSAYIDNVYMEFE